MKQDNQKPRPVKYVLSYGGGVNSTALLFFLIKKNLPLDYVVFADTGNEFPDTYKYLKIIDKFLKRKGIPFKIVKTPTGDSLYDRCERRRVIPSQIWRWCTRDLKVKPIHRFYRSLKSQIYQYIGIDYGEIQRMKDSKTDYVLNIYPLIDNKIDRSGCVQIIEEFGFRVPGKSGCFFCPFNNVQRWNELYDNYPELYNRAMILEENGKHMPMQKLFPLTLRQLKKNIVSGNMDNTINTFSPCGSECMT